MKTFRNLMVVGFLLTLPLSAFSQEASRPVGWKRSGNLGVNLSFSSSQDVVGQTNGTSQTYGLNIRSSLNHFTTQGEWRNELNVTGATTKTPNVPRFVKSSDELRVATTYLYSLESYPKIGPYAKAEAAAPMFAGEDVRSEPKTYRITNLDGSSSSRTETSIRLTEGFKPLTTKESVGFFYRPLQEERLKIETRAGLAALQVAASGQYAVKGVNTAGEVEVNELNDVSQAGLELALSVKGKANENSTYELGAETMTPVINNKESGDDRDSLRLTNVDVFAKLSSNLTTWASFGYDYKLKIQPQLVDRSQQIHMFVINVNHNLF